MNNYPRTESELIQMAQEALDNWEFDPNDDDDMAIKAGLLHLVNPPVGSQASIDEHAKSIFSDCEYGQKDKWDVLENYAFELGRGNK